MRHISWIVAALWCGQPVWAQSAGSIEASLDVDSTLVVMPLGTSDGIYEIEPVLAEVSLTGTVEKVLNNGARLRARLAGRIQHDHPARPGGSGGFGTMLSPSFGAFSGLSANPPVEADANKSRLELAYLQYDGGYGELRLGKNSGIAARFYEGAPSVFGHARLDSALLDPTGLSVIRTRHDVTGPSAKLSYATPRLIGIRAGVSFTPEADADGLDRRPGAKFADSGPDIDAVWELGLNASRRFRERDLRIDASLAWSQADIENDTGAPVTAQMQSLSAGTRIDFKDWRLGASWLNSDNGLDDGDYVAWRLGAGHPWGEYDWSLDYGEAQDDTIRLDAEGWRFGFSKEFAKSTRISIGYTDDRVRMGGLTERARGVVVEITLSEEFMIFSGT